MNSIQMLKTRAWIFFSVIWNLWKLLKSYAKALQEIKGNKKIGLWMLGESPTQGHDEYLPKVNYNNINLIHVK